MSSTVLRWSAPDLGAPPPPPEPEVAPPTLPSVEQLQAIEDAAREEGFKRGHAEGHAEGLAQAQGEMRRLAAQVEGILDNFARPLARLEDEVAQALQALAVRVAGALLGRAYAADPQLLAALVDAAMDAVGSASRAVELRLHPDDIEALTPLLDLPAGTRLVADTTLARGDLRVHAESVRIDGALDSRLRAALAEIQQEPAP
ncbi:FliH/SctL family protein [Coralloluteibacterium thermophilus]|uniref:Flagellar assembly protein FliH n=1 Tax=Coralloluteibacterium thermophilum TaxID=2707049 RepID=A0ABV9NIM1_9GAMM